MLQRKFCITTDALDIPIALYKYDDKSSRFTYGDPWSETSLLAREYNAAGIDAKHITGQLWSITAAELEKVIFAAFVFQELWAEHQHEKYYITHDELRNSDFWCYFHITEKERSLKQVQDERDETPQLTVVTLSPGGLQSEIELVVILDQLQRVKIGSLGVKRKWLIGPPYGINPFALDIVSNFIAAIVSPPDQQWIQELLDQLKEIYDSKYIKQLLSEAGGQLSFLQTALLTYLGAIQSCPNLLGNFSTISMTNLTLDDVDWLQITVTMALI